MILASVIALVLVFHNSVEIKVTLDLQGCLPKNNSYAGRLCFNHRKDGTHRASTAGTAEKW